MCVSVYSQDSLLMSGLYHAFSCVKSTQGLNTKWLRFTKPSKTPLSFLVRTLNSVLFSTRYSSVLLFLSNFSSLLSLLNLCLLFLSVSPSPPSFLHPASLNHILSVLLIPSYSWLWAQINVSSWWTDILTGLCSTCTTLKEDGLKERKRETRRDHVVFMSRFYILRFFCPKNDCAEFKRAVNLKDNCVAY